MSILGEGVDLDRVLDALADRVAERVAKRLRTEPGELVTVTAWAKARSVSTRTARRAIAAHRLEAVRVGHGVRVRADAEIAPVARETKNTTGERASRILALVRGGEK